MKKTLLISSLFLLACGPITPSGDITLKEIKLADFDKIELKGKFNLSISEQKNNLLTMESYPNILDNLEVKVENKTLIIQEKTITKAVDFYSLRLGAKQAIGAYKLADSVDLLMAGKQNVKHLDIIMMDKAKMMGVFRSQTAKIQSRKLAQLNLQGETGQAQIITKDSATIIAPYWQVQKLLIDAQQSTYTELSVKDLMEGKQNNKSQLVYYGAPKNSIQLSHQATVKGKTLR